MIFRTLARSFLCARFISALKSRCLGWPFACHENTAGCFLAGRPGETFHFARSNLSASQPKYRKSITTPAKTTRQNPLLGPLCFRDGPHHCIQRAVSPGKL